MYRYICVYIFEAAHALRSQLATLKRALSFAGDIMFQSLSKCTYTDI